MIDWKYLLFAQYPAFLLLAVYSLVNHLRARKNSAVKSLLWVLLFAAALVVSALFLFFGVHYEYWKLREFYSLGFASWLGVILVCVAAIVHTVHHMERRHSQKVLETELQKAEQAKQDALAQAEEQRREAERLAREDGRREAKQEAEAARFAQAAESAGLEAASGALAEEARQPIELTFAPAPEAAQTPDVPPTQDAQPFPPAQDAPESGFPQ